MNRITRALAPLAVAGALALAGFGLAAVARPLPQTPPSCGSTCNLISPCGSGCGHCPVMGSCSANGLY